MRAVGKQEVPQLKHFGQWRSAGAQGQHRREGVQLSLHVLRLEIAGELGIDNGQAFVYQRQAFVHPVHCSPDVTRAFLRYKPMEGDKSFRLAAGGIEERSA